MIKIHMLSFRVWKSPNFTFSTSSVQVHCKKSWRSSLTPASGDAGPIHTGVEKSFRHPWRKFYYKYRTFPTFFTSVELVRYDYIPHAELFRWQPSNFLFTVELLRQNWKVSKAVVLAWGSNRVLLVYFLTLYHCATLSYVHIQRFS